VTGEVSYSNGNQFSIRNFPRYGPGFGSGYDLVCHCDGNWYSDSGYSYPKINDIPNNFKVCDYEVFQIIKK
jgi:hypothetical protein